MAQAVGEVLAVHNDLTGPTSEPSSCWKIVTLSDSGRRQRHPDERHDTNDNVPTAVQGRRSGFTFTAMNGDDAGMAEQGGDLGLVLEALKLARVRGGRVQEDLESNTTAERLLSHLVDGTHATAPDLADDVKVPEPLTSRHPQSIRFARRAARVGLLPWILESRGRGAGKFLRRDLYEVDGIKAGRSCSTRRGNRPSSSFRSGRWPAARPAR
jgi:hypothetical protein